MLSFPLKTSISSSPLEKTVYCEFEIIDEITTLIGNANLSSAIVEKHSFRYLHTFQAYKLMIYNHIFITL